MVFDSIITKFLVPTVWKLRPEVCYRTLHSFADTELDSGRQAQSCLKVTTFKESVPYLFKMISEEYDHHSMFKALSIALSSMHLVQQINPVEDLLDANASSQKVLNTIAYIYVGEQSVEKLFKLFLAADISPRIKSIFRVILKDELVHKNEGLELIKKLCGRKWPLFILMAKLKIAWFRMKEFSKNIGELWLFIWMTIIYFIAGVHLFFSAKKFSNPKKEELIQNFVRSRIALDEEIQK